MDEDIKFIRDSLDDADYFNDRRDKVEAALDRLEEKIKILLAENGGA